MNFSKIKLGFELLISAFLLFSCREGVKDVDGNHYGTFKINSQVWTAENLNVTRFRNGDSIPEAKSPNEWKMFGAGRKPACCIIQNTPGNAAKYGRLYNWYAVSDPRGLAPRGWHIPSDEEWTSMTNYLGSGVLAAFKMRKQGLQSNDKASEHANFSGLPAGACSSNGEFYGLSSYGYWWSSTPTSSSTALIRILSYINCNVYFYEYDKNCGVSVRCVRD